MRIANISPAKVLLGSLLGAAALLSGCSKDTQKAVEQRVEEPNLMKTWENMKCGSIKVLDASGRNFYEFSGSKFKEAYFSYEDEDCKKQSMEVLYQGDLTFGDKSSEGVRKVDLAYKTVSVRPFTEDAQKTLEKAEACGVKSWPVGKLQDVTQATERVGICKLILGDINSIVDYNLTYIEDGKLYLGNSGVFEKRAQKESNRPDKVDKDKPFQPSNNKLD